MRLCRLSSLFRMKKFRNGIKNGDAKYGGEVNYIGDLVRSLKAGSLPALTAPSIYGTVSMSSKAARQIILQ